MCGRFAFFAPPEAIAKQFGVVEPPLLEPRYNISPTQPAPVLRWDRDGVPSLDTLRWGLIPHWAKDPAIGNRMINARAETVAEKPAFREAFLRRRCLVLASGFYEWGQSPSGKRPFFISRDDQEIMALAGLWERWRSSAGQVVESCVIVTTEASSTLAKVHERMPVLLPTDAQMIWLTGGTTAGDCLTVLRSVSEAPLEIRPVDKTVNNPSNEGAKLLQRAVPD